VRHSLRRDLRDRERWRGLDPEAYHRAVGLLYGVLAHLHAAGDWSDVSAPVRKRRALARRPVVYSRTLAHGFGLALSRSLTKTERCRINGVERWARLRDLKAAR
jgi:hypothetical protein